MTRTNEIRKIARKWIAKIFQDDIQSLSKSTDLNLKKKAHIMYDVGSLALLTQKRMESDSISMFNTQVDFNSVEIFILLFLEEYLEHISQTIDV